MGPILRDPFGRLPETPPEGSPAYASTRSAGAGAGAGAALCRRLRADVERCAAWDHVASPAVDALRHTAGKEYELLLEEKLAALGIPFVTEDALRAEGHAKTPDIKLELPIAVRGRVVNWIDSKVNSCNTHFTHPERPDPEPQNMDTAP